MDMDSGWVVTLICGSIMGMFAFWIAMIGLLAMNYHQKQKLVFAVVGVLEDVSGFLFFGTIAYAAQVDGLSLAILGILPTLNFLAIAVAYERLNRI